MTRRAASTVLATALMPWMLGCLDLSDTGEVPPMPEPHVEVPVPPGDLPEGVWRPMGDVLVRDASLAADEGTVWWVAAVEVPSVEFLEDEEVMITATSSAGTPVIPPAAVIPMSNSVFDPDVLVTPDAIVAKLGGVDTLVQRYGHDGARLGAPQAILVDHGGGALTGFNETALIATPDGGAQFLASLSRDTSEVAIVHLDAAGAHTGTTFVGAPDPADGGSVTSSLAAASLADGSTVLAWDRHFNGCVSTRPSSTLTTTLRGTTVDGIVPVRDLPGSEARPLIAAHGDTAYVSWRFATTDGQALALARHPAVETPLAEIDLGTISVTAMVLASADRGVLLLESGGVATSEHPHTLDVMPFELREGAILFGDRTPIPAVSPDASERGVGLVHIGEDRYVVGWIESRFEGPFLEVASRLYAMQIDLAGVAMRAAPPVLPRPPATDATRRGWWCP